MLKNICDLFRRNSNTNELDFIFALKRKGLVTLRNKRARLRERIAFAKAEWMRQRDMKFLQTVEHEIKRRETYMKLHMEI